MAIADNLREIADKVDELETLQIELEELRQHNRELQNEVDWMSDILRQMGVDDVWGDFGINSLSVADVMALEKAISTARMA